VSGSIVCTGDQVYVTGRVGNQNRNSSQDDDLDSMSRRLFPRKSHCLGLSGIAVSALLALFVPGLLAQGVKTPVVELPLPGEWSEQRNWVAGRDPRQNFAFYDGTKGTVLYIQKKNSPLKAEELEQLIQQLKKTEPELTEHPGFARFLASSYFLFPEDYLKQVSGDVDATTLIGQAARLLAYRSPNQEVNRHEKTPRMWDVEKVKGDAQWFYVSQLTPGFIVKKWGDAPAVEEEYAPTKLTLAERRRTNAGEILLFELETVDSPPDKAIERFQMPPALRGQRIRYGWVVYAPQGFPTTEPVLNLVFATAANSGVDCNLLSSLLSQRK